MSAPDADEDRVHNHPPYRPVCNERMTPSGLRGACLNDDGTDRATTDADERVGAIVGALAEDVEEVARHLHALHCGLIVQPWPPAPTGGLVLYTVRQTVQDGPMTSPVTATQVEPAEQPRVIRTRRIPLRFNESFWLPRGEVLSMRAREVLEDSDDNGHLQTSGAIHLSMIEFEGEAAECRLLTDDSEIDFSGKHVMSCTYGAHDGVAHLFVVFA